MISQQQKPVVMQDMMDKLIDVQQTLYALQDPGSKPELSQAVIDQITVDVANILDKSGIPIDNKDDLNVLRFVIVRNYLEQWKRIRGLNSAVLHPTRWATV